MLLKTSDHPVDAEEISRIDQNAKELDQPNPLPNGSLNDQVEKTLDAHTTGPKDDRNLQGYLVEAQPVSITSDLHSETNIVAQHDPQASDLTNGTSVDDSLQLWVEDQNAEEQELVPDVRSLHKQQQCHKRVDRSHKYVLDRRSTAIPL